jgi:hypothetical protein
MALNPNIALAARGVELQDPLAQYGRVMAIQQAGNQNQLAQYQLGAAQRGEARDLARTNALAQAGSDETAVANALLKSGDIAGYSSFVKAAEDRKTQKLTQQKTEGELFDTSMKQIRNFWGNVRTPEEAMAIHDATHRDPIINKRLQALGITEQMGRQQIIDAAQDPTRFAEFVKKAQVGAEKFMEMNKPQLSTMDEGGQIVSRTFAPLTGELKTIGTTAKTMAPGESERLKNDATRIKQEGQRIGLEGRRVAVMEENNRRDADPAFQQRMGGARAVGEAIAKGDVAAQQALPKVITRAEEGMRLIDELIGKRDSKTGALLDVETVDPKTGKTVKVKSKPHPGFQGSVGATWLPGWRFVQGSDEAGFMSRYDQIKDASFLEAFESLKGGGAITEKEGAKATSAINRMSTSTDEKEFIRAAMDLQDVIRTGVKNAQSRASRSGGSGAPAAPASGGVIDFGSLK